MLGSVSGPHCVIVGYPQVAQDNLEALRAAMARRGIGVTEVLPHNVAVLLPPHGGQSTAVPVLGPGSVVLHRGIITHTELLVHATRAWKRAGAVVLNDMTASLLARDKFAACEALRMGGVPVAAMVALDNIDAVPTLPWQGPTVLKPARGARGWGVHLATGPAQLAMLRKEIPEAYQPFWCAQPVVGSQGHDVRAFVVDGHCVACVRRVARPDELRANLGRGAVGSPLALDGPQARMAERAVRVLDLDFASVDLLEDGEHIYVNEVDPWGGFVNIAAICGTDVAGALADLVVASAASV